MTDLSGKFLVPEWQSKCPTSGVVKILAVSRGTVLKVMTVYENERKTSSTKQSTTRKSKLLEEIAELV